MPIPVKKRSSQHLMSETVTLPGGETARVQIHPKTRHARWNATQIKGVRKVIVGTVIDSRFYPYDPGDSELIFNSFKRRRKPSLYDGSYYPWK